MKYPENDWRNDPGLKSKTVYKRRYALLPIKIGNEKIWLKHYYTKYVYWGHNTIDDLNNYGLHVDKCENITASDYIIVKLAEGI